MDLMDQHVIYYLQTHPEMQKKHCIEWVSPGVYLMNGREIQVTWQHSPDPGHPGWLMVVDGPLYQPFDDYMQNQEHTAVYNNKGIRSSNLHMMPKETRMTFQDSGEKYSRLEAMKVAKEQALVREQAAHYTNTGKSVPADLRQKYQKTIDMKLWKDGKEKDKTRWSKQWRSKTTEPHRHIEIPPETPQKPPGAEKENVAMATGMKTCQTMMNQNGVPMPVTADARQPTATERGTPGLNPCATMMKVNGTEVALSGGRQPLKTPKNTSALAPCATMMKVNGNDLAVGGAQKPPNPLNSCVTMAKINGMEVAVNQTPGSKPPPATNPVVAPGMNPMMTGNGTSPGRPPAERPIPNGLNPCLTMGKVNGRDAPVASSSSAPMAPADRALSPCLTMAKVNGMDAPVTSRPPNSADPMRTSGLKPCVTMAKVNGTEVAVSQAPKVSNDRTGMPGLNPCVTMFGVGAQQTALKA